MVDNINFVSVKEVISRVTRHPMLQDLDLEAAIQYTVDFIAEIGLPNIYEDKEACVKIEKFRGLLPCDLISIIQVRDERTKVCLRAMTDTFNGSSSGIPGGASFKAKGKYITTSFENGEVRIAYRAIPVDENELPMLPDHPVFMKALELYIKRERFSVLFDLGKIKGDVFSKAEQDYCWQKGRCHNLFLIPSESEMESITGMMHRLIPSTHEFQNGYKGLGDREHFKRH